MICSTNYKLGAATFLGVALTLFGSIFAVYWPSLFDSILNKQLALTPASKSFELWEVTPIPMYIEFYFFNWTNSKSLKNATSKPILEELGPYIFREHRKKVINAWNSDNYTVTFQQNRTWIFEPTLSNGSLDDVITTINIPAITAAFAVRNEPVFVKFMLNQAMKILNTKIVVQKMVREFLFEGYSDPLLDLASLLPPGFVPVSIPFDKFGWFYTRNGSATYDGVFNMFTGVDEIKKFGEMGQWDYEKNTSYYHSYCGMVNGSAGEFFPPKREKTSISLFSPDVCRTLTLNYKEEISVDGISGYRYWGDDTMFNNKSSIPDNWCFCISQDCAPNGAIDVSSCKWGAPAFISFPHFYHADPWYRESVIGMKPNIELHQMFIDLEPRTGIPLQVSAALQINILLQPMKEFTLLENVPKIYFPAIWFKQTARIDDEIRPQLKLLTIIPPAGTIVSYVLLSVGVTLILVVSVYYITVKCRKDSDSEYLNSISGVYEFKKSLMSTLRLLILTATSDTPRTRMGKVKPESVVTLHNGVRIIHYSMSEKPFAPGGDYCSNTTAFITGPSKHNMQVTSLCNDKEGLHDRDEENTPLQADPYF